MNEQLISEFWNSHPCGEDFVGGAANYRADYEAFFERYDAYRYSTETHIPACLDGLEVAGKRVLEVGLGQGADAEQLIRRGALWSGLDLTAESVARVRTRLALRNLPFQELKQGSILSAPYPDDHFNLIFSHGVLHHVPDILAAQRELHRMLKPDGELVVMLYAKYSANYLLSIAVLRRLGLLYLLASGKDPGGKYSDHLKLARRHGIATYLRLANFVHTNTDGPHNPYSKVYSLRTVADDFPNFRITRAYKRFMHAPPLPIGWLPLQTLLGWHLWVHLTPTQ